MKRCSWYTAVIIIICLLIGGVLKAQSVYKVTTSINRHGRCFINIKKTGKIVKSISADKLTTAGHRLDSISILAYKKISGSHYILFWYDYNSHPEKPDGHCGAGFEEFVASLKLDNKLKIVQFDPQKTVSCWESFENDYKFDARHPERGIKVVPMQ